MNILYINHYAGSDVHGMEFRPSYLAKEWKKKGFDTTIVAANFSHLRKVNPTVSEDFQEEKVEGIDYCWVKTKKYDGSGVYRILSMVQFVLKLIINAKDISNKYKPDVVICSSTYPFDTYAGQKISKYSKAKLIHEVHDLWPLTPMELGGYSKNHPFIKVMQRAEISAYKKSNSVISILPNIKEYVDTLDIKANIINIPNGILLKDEENKMPANERIKDKVKQLREEGHFIVGYAGGISISNAILDLVKAAEVLKDKKFAFIIIGDGIKKDQFMEYKKQHNLDAVYSFDPINKKEIHNTLLEMDALYIGSKKSKLYRYGISANKVFDYMLTGKPIIDALDTEHSPLNYSNVSFRAKAEDVGAIAKAIERASLLSKEELNDLKDKTINYVISNHSYKKLADDFAKEFL